MCYIQKIHVCLKVAAKRWPSQRQSQHPLTLFNLNQQNILNCCLEYELLIIMPFEQLTFPKETQGGLKAIINFTKGEKRHLDPYHQVD